MKIITINTHSLEEPDYERKLHQFGEVVLAEKPDVFAMQEVNQSVSAKPVEPALLPGYTGCPDFQGEIRRDNHGARLAGLLWEKGQEYFWTWVPAKLGYGKYDEGLAIFSRAPILETDSFRISRCDDYQNWKTRRILGVRTEQGWFYTVHMGWWDDEEEPFSEQWQRLEQHLREVKKRKTWLMGDFNSLDRISGEGYDLVRKSGWLDTYPMAEEKDSGITVGKMIDGWRERLSESDAWEEPENGEEERVAADAGKREKKEEAAAVNVNLRQEGMRIDYIWCSHEIPVRRSQVICNGKKYPVVSDHYGVMVEI